MIETQLRIIGILLIILSLIHLIFPKYFEWEKELSSVSLINKQMMYVHTLFIGIMVFLMGLLCFTCANDLVTTRFGKIITFGLAVFWTIRLFVQFFGYSSRLWKGKKLETFIHILFASFWLYLSIVFWEIALS